MIHPWQIDAHGTAAEPKIELAGGVYVPARDSRLLLETFAARGPLPRADVLDVCCGSGVLGIAAAMLGHRVVAVDIERESVTVTRRNALLNDVEIEACEGDLFAPVEGWRFDAVVANPPYVPTPEGDEHATWCDGGVDGRAVINRICREAPGVLREGGKLWLVQSSLASIEATTALLEWTGFRARVVAREPLALGPVSRARISHLHEHGHLPRGARYEELAVIEARYAP